MRGVFIGFWEKGSLDLQRCVYLARGNISHFGMEWNAVPVELAYHLACAIRSALS